MKNKVIYLFRFLGTLVLSYIITMSLCLLAVLLITEMLTLIPEFFNNILNFSIGDVFRSVAENQIVPGLGFYSSISEDPNISIRGLVLLTILGVIVALAIIGGISYGLFKIIRGSKVMTLTYGLIAAHSLYRAIDVIFIYDVYIKMGINKNLLFYLVIGIFLLLLILIYLVIGLILWKNE